MEHYRWTLPDVDHVFLPGHRIMVQIQSSLFPLYDRNPQTYVENIMYAKPGDYKKATQSVWFGGATATAVTLPVAASSALSNEPSGPLVLITVRGKIEPDPIGIRDRSERTLVQPELFADGPGITLESRA